jgi:hypothetical protein
LGSGSVGTGWFFTIAVTAYRQYDREADCLRALRLWVLPNELQAMLGELDLGKIAGNE